MTPTGLSPDSFALVMLCSRLALPAGAGARTGPLSPTEWTRLAKRLDHSEWHRPADLTGRSVAELQESLGLGL